jgi:hypothetical protein
MGYSTPHGKYARSLKRCPLNIRTFFSGSNYVQGSLNWGPASFLNGVSKSYSWWEQRRKSFGGDFHTYALEWTDKWL